MDKQRSGPGWFVFLLAALVVAVFLVQLTNSVVMLHEELHVQRRLEVIHRLPVLCEECSRQAALRAK
jgi:hypothetical protein